MMNLPIVGDKSLLDLMNGGNEGIAKMIGLGLSLSHYSRSLHASSVVIISAKLGLTTTPRTSQRRHIDFEFGDLGLPGSRQRQGS
jgi:hypothetical protein